MTPEIKQQIIERIESILFKVDDMKSLDTEQEEIDEYIFAERCEIEEAFGITSDELLAIETEIEDTNPFL